MIDEMNKDRLRISTDGIAGPYLMVPPRIGPVSAEQAGKRFRFPAGRGRANSAGTRRAGPNIGTGRGTGMPSP